MSVIAPTTIVRSFIFAVFFVECKEGFAIAIETAEALGLIVDEEEW